MGKNQACVIGASITGLVAARVLSDHFDQVVLFDRDTLPAESANRKGVPQGWHGHGLLASGFSALKQMFPCLERDLLQAGAHAGDVIGDVRWFQHGYYKAKFQSGLGGILLSRALLETSIRAQVRQIPNVSIVNNAHVHGLLTDAARKRVSGVRVQQTGGPATDHPAALVVDASGRGSRAPEWLAELGYAKPATDEVEISVGYTSRTFRRRTHDLNGDFGVILAPKPPKTRVGFMLAIEGDRWMATIGGWTGDYAPTDSPGFLEFARSLSRPDIYEVIKDAEPLTDAVTYRFPCNLRRRYERLDRFPEGFLVMGDAICSFNPIYGQGMSVTSLEALALGACLDRGLTADNVWRPFIKEASKIIETPWTIAAGGDFAFNGVTGPKPAGTDAINWYLERVHRVASTDRVVCRAFFDVANLLTPATTLFHPKVVGRVVRGCMRKSTVDSRRSSADSRESLVVD